MSKNSFLLYFSLSVFAALAWIYKSTPGYLMTQGNLQRRITFLDRRGIPIKSYAPHESFDWAAIHEIPVELKDLILLAEDKNFYFHTGVDFTSTMRSLWMNLKNQSIRSGASTITQQAHRLAHKNPRTLRGKVRTMLGAWKLEHKYSKDEIYQFYLNALPYGRNVAGVKMAAEVFFGKELHLLNLSEMATLAILPRAPSLYQNKENQQALHQKKNELLARYAKTGFNQDVLELEKKVGVTFEHNKSSWDNYHFINKLTSLPDYPASIDQGVVHTTLDLTLQKEASRIMQEQLRNLEDLNVTHAAVVVMESATGDILSYIGSQDLTHERGGQFDALDVKRQPGSALKPLTYALALQSGKELNSILADIPSSYKTGLGQFLPRNYDQTFSGPRLMREALANSLNLPAVALADELGIEALYKFYSQMGLPLTQGHDHYGVGLTLGNIEMTPLNMVSIYSAFSTLGDRVEPRYFQQSSIKKIPTPLSSKAAFLIGDVLSDRVARREEFGENNPFDLPFYFSVKTGTSTDFRDNWAVGYNSAYTVVVWVGNMDQQPMKKVSGITGAGPILSKVTRFLMREKYLGRPFPPAEVSKVPVCALSGMRPGNLCPHVKHEYMTTGSGPYETCQFHQELVVRECHEPGDETKVVVSVLPDLYHSFIQTHPSHSIEGQLSELCLLGNPDFQRPEFHSLQSLAIARPLPGSIYAIDPNIPRKLQKLKLELNQFSNVKKVQWLLDGKSIPGSAPDLDWPMEKGKHSFEAQVEFTDGKTNKTLPLEVTVL